jgi:hypothetical protein
VSPAPSAAATAFAAFVAVVTGVTFAQSSGLIAIRAVAASPREIAAGKLWLLFTSGLLVQKPLGLSLVSFAALGALVLVACGYRVLAWSAVLGHVLSTLIVYGLLGVGWAASPELFGHTWSAPDYGVSTISAAWLGAIASLAWRRSGDDRAEKALIAAGCLAIAAFGWMIRGHLNVLDSEHAVAFVTGAAISWRLLPVNVPATSRSFRHG